MTGAELMADLKKVPWWGWAVGGGGVLGAGFYLYKRHQNATTAPSSSASSSASQVTGEPIPAGLNVADLAGIPFAYQDYDAEYAGDTSGNPGDTPAPPPPAGPFPQQGISLPGTIGAPVSELANNANVNVPPAAPFPQHPIPSAPIPVGSPPPPAAPLPQQPASAQVPPSAPYPNPEYIFEFHNAG